MAARYGALWSRDELVLALYLYCQVPFARTKANNPEVIRLATLLGRTPSSVARKLGNFGAFDPRLALKGIKGLTHVGRGDEAVWREFDGRWEALVGEAQDILISPTARASRSPFTQTALLDFANRQMRLPGRFPPKAEHLRWHRETVFRG